MNLLLWVLQLLAALLYTASGVMKVFMLDSIVTMFPHSVPCPVASVRHYKWLTWCALRIDLAIADSLAPRLNVVAASALSLESFVFVGVHVKYRELAPILMCIVWGFVSLSMRMDQPY